MPNTAKKIESELSPELEKRLREEAAPLIRDFRAGKIKGKPLVETYEYLMHNMAERRKAKKNG